MLLVLVAPLEKMAGATRARAVGAPARPAADTSFPSFASLFSARSEDGNTDFSALDVHRFTPLTSKRCPPRHTPRHATPPRSLRLLLLLLSPLCGAGAVWRCAVCRVGFGVAGLDRSQGALHSKWKFMRDCFSEMYTETLTIKKVLEYNIYFI
jgi:hypothetical protein